MTGKTKCKTHMSLWTRLALALGMLLIAVLFLYRGGYTWTENESAVTAPEQTAKPAEIQEKAEERTGFKIEETSLSAAEPAAAEAPQQPVKEYRPIVYDKRSYDLVSDMVYAFRHQVPDREGIIARDAEALKQHDPALGEAWSGIMDYWDYADNRMELNYDALPEDLPKDNSLCIVVLGFQLLPDGGMSEEMLGRCELARSAAEQFPNAYLAVTGGGTAYRNPDATEAGVMAQWFLEHGIEEERLILEDRSSTTEENAKFTLAILTEQYPQVKSVAIVTSDYHIPLGCTLFTEAALLYGCEYGELPWRVDAHLALRGYGLTEYTNPAEQALYIWALANPQLKKD